MSRDLPHKISELNPFELERHRHFYSKSKKINNFLLTYKKGIQEIKNTNTGKKWDSLNVGQISFTSNPMAYDRVYKVSRMIKGEKTELLDIGFGSGLLEELLFNSSTNRIFVKGIDISAYAVANLSKRYPNWEFRLADVLSYKYEKNKYDYVLALELFEHIDPTKIFRLLRKLHKALKKGGTLIVSVPLNENLEEMINSNTNPNSHTRVYTEETLEMELEISGFSSIEKIKLYAFHKLYFLKSFICKYINIKDPNNLIIKAIKV